MKIIPLDDSGAFKSREIIRQIMTVAPQGVTFAEMHKRIRVIDALDAAENEESLHLEDADYIVLKAALEKFAFSLAHPELFRILQSIAEAKDAGKSNGKSPEKHVEG